MQVKAVERVVTEATVTLESRLELSVLSFVVGSALIREVANQLGIEYITAQEILLDMTNKFISLEGEWDDG